MAVDILVITSNPQDFADGAWPRAHFNGDAGSGKFHWRFNHTAATQGAWGAYFGRPTGGVWRTSSGTIDIYDTADNLLISRAVTIPAGSYVDFTVDANTGSLKLENFSSGNGTFSFTPADIFTAGGLRVGGVFGQTGWSIAGTFSNVDDADAATSGVGSSTGTSTITASGASIASGDGAAAGTSTADAVSTAPGGSGASSGTSTVAGAGASIATASGSSAGSSTVGASSPSPLSIGIGAVVQRLYSTNPSTGTLSTWDTNLTISAINTGTDTLTSAGHGFIANTFPGPFYLATTGTFPGGTDGTTRYWCVVVDADNIRLATSGQNAKAGTVVNLTSSGSGTISLVRVRNSEASGSAFVTMVMRGVWSSDSSAATDNKGNNYTDRNDEFAYANFPGSRVRARVDLSATGGAAHTVSATWGNIGGTGDEVTTAIVEVKGATLCKAFAHNETAIGSSSITTPSITTSDEAMVLVALCGNGPVNQDHTWTAVDGAWTKHVDASAEQDTNSNGYIQLTWFWRKYNTAQTNLTAQFSGISNEGAQVFVWAFQTKDPSPAVGSSSGTSSVAATGQAVATGAGASSGSSTVQAVAEGSVGSATGTSLAVGVGVAVLAGAGSASGSASVAGAGAALASAQGVSAGSSTAAGAGASIALSSGASAGAGGATGAGASIASGVAASSGSSTTVGAGVALAASIGGAVGTGSTAGAGGSIASAAGAASGSSSATGSGTAVASGIGLSESAGSATGSSVPGGIGYATGVGDASGVGVAVIAASGSSAGAGSASAQGGSIASGAGLATGVGAASGASPITSVDRRLPSVLSVSVVGVAPFAFSDFGGAPIRMEIV